MAHQQQEFTTIISAQKLLEAQRGGHFPAIVDCRVINSNTPPECIPGAFHADIDHDLAGKKTGNNGRHPLPRVDDFVGFLRAHGVHDRTQIVAYDEGAGMNAARLWFLCRWIGHGACAVLDGGLAEWRRQQFPLANGFTEAPNDGTIAARVRSELAVSTDQVARAIETGEFTVIDARSAPRFRGEVEPLDPLAGHIPNARNIPYSDNYDASGKLKDAAALRSTFLALDLPPEKIVHQCGSGVSAAVNLLAMEHSGLHGSRLYPGSWSEWIADRSRPTIPPRKF